MVEISLMQASSVTSVDPYWLKHSCFPPASRLVGVELNPGPPKKGTKMVPGKIKQGKKVSRETSFLQSPTENQRGAAMSGVLPRFMPGLRDMRNMELTWQAGYILVGNGSVGATNSVYFSENAGAGITTTVLSDIPIAGSDSVLGQTYISDLEKHFARKVIKKQYLQLLSLVSSTANSMEVFIGPKRGFGNTVSTTAHTDATAGLTVANVISMSGSQKCASYQDLTMDLTKFISGGSGPLQNEFNIQAGNAVTTVVGNAIDGDGIIPTVFCVAGTCATSTLQATVTHIVVIRQIVDLLDFIGGQVASDPLPLLRLLPNAATHSCAASSPCLQCGVHNDYVAVAGGKTSKSQ